MSLTIPAQVPSLSIGGRVFTDLSNLIILYAYGDQTASNSTMRKAGASSGYQVTAGKTLTVFAVRAMVQTVNASGLITIAQSDNDVGMKSATALTNPVYLGGNANNALMSSSALGVFEAACDKQIAATKYLSAIIGGPATVVAFCYEA